MRVKDAVGRFGEQLAVDHLERSGLSVVERNWRCREGEVDIVARDGDTLVVVEVKTRSSGRFGLPVEAVDRVKRARLRRLAIAWMDEHRATGCWWTAVRFDVVGVVRRTDDGPTVTHLRGAF